MSFDNKGGQGGITVSVTMTPDLSGNFICDGVSDHIQILAAIEYVHALGGGTVILGVGAFVGEARIYQRTDVWVKGQGYNTSYQLPQNTGAWRGGWRGVLYH